MMRILDVLVRVDQAKMISDDGMSDVAWLFLDLVELLISCRSQWPSRDVFSYSIMILFTDICGLTVKMWFKTHINVKYTFDIDLVIVIVLISV